MYWFISFCRSFYLQTHSHPSQQGQAARCGSLTAIARIARKAFPAKRGWFASKCPRRTPGSFHAMHFWALYCLVVYLPFWKIWVRQLGWWHSLFIEKHVPNHQPAYVLFIKRLVIGILRNSLSTFRITTNQPWPANQQVPMGAWVFPESCLMWKTPCSSRSWAAAVPAFFGPAGFSRKGGVCWTKWIRNLRLLTHWKACSGSLRAAVVALLRQFQ